MKAYALSAFGRNDIIDILRNGGTDLPVELPRNPAAVNRSVGTFGLARPAVDAIAGNDCRHLKFSRPQKDSKLNKIYRRPRSANMRPRRETQRELILPTITGQSFSCQRRRRHPFNIIITGSAGCVSKLLKMVSLREEVRSPSPRSAS